MSSPSVATPGKRLVQRRKISPIKRMSPSALEHKQTDSEAPELADEANISDDEGGTRIGDIYIPPPIPAYCSAESKGPRLIIKKIENNNFKSYAGKVVLGPFHHCFTAIVGPNGSGKSNVIDSMLFVFGYRANKIRCKKLSTLLHNSAKHPGMSMCSVAVYFRQIVDKPDGTCEEVPDSEIVVERTAYRDNTSFYSINQRRVQFKEVAKLLKQHNVDLDHNRFLILQGEVESISMMKPKGQTENETGMLEYLEDIVGTTRYKEPLRKINSRVEELTEERTEKHNRCKLAEREMNDLEQPYNEAVEYLRRENENKRTKNLRIQKYLSEKNKKLAEYTTEHDVVVAELKQHDDAAETLESELQQKEKLAQDEMKQFEACRTKKEAIQKLMEEAKIQFMQVQHTMAATNKRRKENKTQMEKFEEELLVMRKVPEKNATETAECEAKVEQLTKQKIALDDELQRNYESMREHTKPLVEKRETFEAKLIELKPKVDEAKQELALNEQELKLLKHSETTETRKYETMRSSYEDSQLSLDEKQTAVAQHTADLPGIQAEIVEKTATLQQLQREEAQLSEQVLSLKTEIGERMSRQQAHRSNNKVLDFLMKRCSEGKIPGILGRLGDLGAIDAKYDVAISTACGRLDNIIVETVDTAQACIEQLKRYDIGRASFIALEKVQHLAHQSAPINTPEEAPRLYDLVRVEDERVLPAFYFALRNTLVATDLEQATRIAYGARRFRVATLAGDVIETSGTMSGGGRTQIRGKMGTKVQTQTARRLAGATAAGSSFVAQQALEELQVQAEQLQSKLNFCQQEQGTCERELQQLKAARLCHEAEGQKMTITIQSLEVQLPRIYKQLEAQKRRMEATRADPTQVAALEAQIAKRQQVVAQCEKAADEVSSKIQQIRAEIDAIHGDKIKPVQAKIKSIDAKITKLDSHIAKLQVEVMTSERNVEKMSQDIDDLLTEIHNAEQEIMALSKARQRHDDETVQLAADLEAAQAAIDSAKSESSGLQGEILQLRKAASDNKLKRVEIDQRVQSVAAKMADVKAQIPHWRDQLLPLSLSEIPGDSEPLAPLKTYTEEELAAYTLQDIQYKESVQEELLKKRPNLSCVSEYLDKRNVYVERVKVLEDITTKRNEMRQLYDDVRKKRYNEFMQGFHIITRKLKEMYQMITQGGDAELELVDSMDPFTEGVSFSVRPQKKTWKNISNLSGGEKTLSSLALVFALHYYKPSPLYFMDEIDAALDFKNISIVAHYIKERTKNAQFIIISLRSNMFELSDFIVGIFKVTDCTDSVTVRNHPPVESEMPQQAGDATAAAPGSETIVPDDEDKDDDDGGHHGEESHRVVPPPGGNRDTTFMPPLESTALTQTSDTSNDEHEASNVVREASPHESSIFKKPLAPLTAPRSLTH